MSMNDEGYVVRIRGLPWSCTQEEVASFFSGKNNGNPTNIERYPMKSVSPLYFIFRL